ncbi:MAG: class I SAM-dependent methyltransferase [Sphaerochaetaceae bacterium]|nr:class I SAM-dependent methyltransferase [Sphaerochaetaceae bacterium]
MKQNVAKQWNAGLYQAQCGFVYQYGEDVLSLLPTELAGKKVLDLGCGSGVLTHRLKGLGADVIGVDSSSRMLALASEQYPDLDVQCMDALDLDYHDEFDVVFSNAVFHWISNQDRLLANVAAALKPGGTLACEFGGVGCGASVHESLARAFGRRGLAYRMPFYFPSIGEYAPRLESHGLLVRYAVLFDRPTRMAGVCGLEDWIHMFVTQPFDGLDLSMAQDIIAEAADELRPVLYNGADWTIDYVRIRFKAEKQVFKTVRQPPVRTL